MVLTRPASPQAPIAVARGQRSTWHGVTREDCYDWLRDRDWAAVLRDPAMLDPAIRAHLEAENIYTTAVLEPIAPLRRRLYDELKGRLEADDMTIPWPDGAHAYFFHYRQGDEHACYRRVAAEKFHAGEDMATLNAASVCLFDPNIDAAGSDYYQIGDCHHSPDHRHLAYSVDRRGNEYCTIHYRRLDGSEAEDGAHMAIIDEAAPYFVWHSNSAALFYIRYDDEHRPYQLWHHRLGTPQSDDRLIYEEADKGFFVSVDITSSRRFLIVDVHDHETSEVHLLDLSDDSAVLRCVAPRRTGIAYEIAHHAASGQLILCTNADGAEDSKIVVAPLHASGPRHWRDLIAHEKGRLITTFCVNARFLSWLEMSAAVPQLALYRLADGALWRLAIDRPIRALRLMEGLDYHATTIRYSVESPAHPRLIYDYDLDSGGQIERKRQRVPSGHDADAYCETLVHAISTDGARVPVTIIHRHDTPLDGSAPLLLYGYGAYGISMPADFNPHRFGLIDRGFVYAIAHIRGGKECGHGWYLDGKGAMKTHSFDDFITAAKTLIAAGYSSPGRVIAEGASAGGMLMGAVANRAPELFAAILAIVPFVDVLNTMLDASLPLTPPEWKEWGNPIEDEDAFHRIKGYSPYDALCGQDYPAVLAIGALTDPRVGYWEPAKWIARLREVSTARTAALLYTHMGAGHGGSSGRYGRLDDLALVQSFALYAVGHDRIGGVTDGCG